MGTISRELGTLLRFGSVGLVVTGFYLVIALGLVTIFAVSPQTANLMAFLAALGLSFVSHHHITFRSQRPWRVAGVRFAVTAFVAYLCSAGLLWTLSATTGLSPWLQMILAACVIPLANYIAGRLWVF